MQLISPPAIEKFKAVENAIQSERILRYLPAANMNSEAAFSLYLWNCALCESFFISLHFAEIVCRNAIHKRLVDRLGQKWFTSETILRILDERFRSELNDAVIEETRQHGVKLTAHHIVSALNFSFWEHLMTKRFERLLWANGISSSFPNAPNRIDREKLRELIESVRRWRNRIAHHRAIFDKSPNRKHQDVLFLIKWVCKDTGDWVASSSKVSMAIGMRPTLD